MASDLVDISEATTTKEGDAQLALESVRVLTELLDHARGESLALRLLAEGGEEGTVAVPVSAFRLLKEILLEMSKGNSVALVPVDAELTTQQAADMLNVSRPFLVDQMEKGAITFRKVGSHRRVRLEDVVRYKRDMNRERRVALEELSELDQQLGLGY